MKRSRKALLGLGAGLSTALLAYFGTGLDPRWPLLWLAPVPVLAIAPHLSRTTAFLLGFVSWLLGELNLWTYAIRVIHAPVPAFLAMVAGPAIVFGGGVLFFRTFLLRRSLWLAAITLPVYWVTYEYLSAITSPHGTFGNLAYTQMDWLPLIQVAAVSGIWGISFAVLLFGSTMAALLSGFGTRGQRARLATTVAVTLCAVVLSGLWRLRSPDPSGQVGVMLISRDISFDQYLAPEQDVLDRVQSYAAEIRRAFPFGTAAIVLPEKIGRLSDTGLAQVDAIFSQAAKDLRAAIVVGLVRKSERGAFNSSRFYSASGRVEATYDKHHLVPGLEAEKPGMDRVVVTQPNGGWGLQICKDLDFPWLSRDYAKDGASLILSPAWDFDLDGWLHARMAVLRGIESGFALARSARSGLLTVSDNRGRILAEAPSRAEGFVVVSQKIDLGATRTFYVKAGDWFAVTCTTMLVALAVSRVVAGLLARKTGPAAALG